jgi:hypothetical protein
MNDFAPPNPKIPNSVLHRLHPKPPASLNSILHRLERFGGMPCQLPDAAKKIKKLASGD